MGLARVVWVEQSMRDGVWTHTLWTVDLGPSMGGKSMEPKYRLCHKVTCTLVCSTQLHCIHPWRTLMVRVRATTA